MRKCGNCLWRACNGEFEIDYCETYIYTRGEQDEVEAARDCPEYEYGTPDCLKDEMEV